MRPSVNDSVFVDFETPVEGDYSLSKMSARRYILDSRFKVLSVAVAIGNGPIQVFHAKATGGGGVEAGVAAIRAALPDRTLVVHNAGFDALILQLHFGIQVGRVFDTGAYASYLRLGGSLANVAQHVGLKKFEAPEFTAESLEDPEKLKAWLRYNANDVFVMRRFYEAALADLTFPDAEFEVVNATISSNLRGLVIDAERARDVALTVAEERAKAVTALAMTYPDFDTSALGSPDKVHDYVTKKFGVELPSLRKDDYDALTLIQATPGLKEFMKARRVVLALGRTAKQLQRFAEVAPRVYFPLKYGAAFTGRFAGSGRDADRLNIHSLPKAKRAQHTVLGQLRSIITPEEGSLFVAADLATIEVRVIAALAGETRMLEMLRAGQDVYVYLAHKVFPDLRIVKNGENDHLRGLAKQAVLGLGFGMGFNTFQRRILLENGDVQLGLIRRVFDAYQAEFPRIAELRKSLFKAFRAAIDRNESLTVGRCGFQLMDSLRAEGPTVRVTLPSNRRLFYRAVKSVPAIAKFGPTTEYWFTTRFEYDATSGKTSAERGGKNRRFPDGRVRTLITPHRLVENVVQAVARDIFVHQMLVLSSAHVVRPAFHVHDELVGEVTACTCAGAEHDDGCSWRAGLGELVTVMSKIPPTLPSLADIPVAAEPNMAVCEAYAG